MAASRTYQHEGLTFDADDSGGTGDPVILLHGFPGSRESWDAVTPLLTAARYRVLAPDQRGYSPGARPAGRRSYAMDHLAGDVIALADSAGIERFHLVGHDWGAAVGWAVAAWHPDRLLTMTSLATPHPKAMMRAVASSTQGLRSGYMLFCQLPWLPEVSMTSGPGAAMFERTLVKTGLSPARAKAYLRFMQSGATGPAVNWYRALPFTLPNRYRSICVPTLYIYGTDDCALGRVAADLTGRYVNAPYRYEVLDGVSHWIPEESPETTALLLLEHFREYAER